MTGQGLDAPSDFCPDSASAHFVLPGRVDDPDADGKGRPHSVGVVAAPLGGLEVSVMESSPTVASGAARGPTMEQEMVT